jgi:hypothetical protein
LDEFDSQQVTIKDNSHGSGQVLPIRVQEDCLHKLLTDPTEQLRQVDMMERFSNCDETITKGFSQQEGVDLDETLTPMVEGFS